MSVLIPVLLIILGFSALVLVLAVLSVGFGSLRDYMRSHRQADEPAE
jgi:hypothetical protein